MLHGKRSVPCIFQPCIEELTFTKGPPGSGDGNPGRKYSACKEHCPGLWETEQINRGDSNRDYYVIELQNAGLLSCVRFCSHYFRSKENDSACGQHSNLTCCICLL